MFENYGVAATGSGNEHNKTRVSSGYNNPGANINKLAKEIKLSGISVFFSEAAQAAQASTSG